MKSASNQKKKKPPTYIVLQNKTLDEIEKQRQLLRPLKDSEAGSRRWLIF